MQQYVVPQFIDVEDKIIGPLTTRQFIIIMAAGFMIFLEFSLASFGFFLFQGIVTLAVAIVLAFVKFNGMPFHFFLINLIQTLKRPRLRVWQKQVHEFDVKQAIQPAAAQTLTPAGAKPLLQQSRLQQLTLLVDTGGAYQPEEEAPLIKKSES